MLQILHRLALLFACTLPLAGTRTAIAQQPLTFGVAPQRSATLTAHYWNPILNYVSARSGVPLVLRLAKTPAEHTEMLRRGEFDFAFSRRHLLPGRNAAGYRVFARPIEAEVPAEIVVGADSALRALAQLDGSEVGFSHREAFVGYVVPMDALLRAGVRVRPRLVGNAEAVLGQLKAGRIAAAGVNARVMRDFAARAGFSYRVLWRSKPYPNIPIVFHPRVDKARLEAVRSALLAMANDRAGAAILAAGAQLLRLNPPYGFIAAQEREYDEVRAFFQTTALHDQ